MKLFSSSGLFLYGIGFSLPLLTIANRPRQVHSNSLQNNQWNSQANQNHAQPEMESHVSGSNTQGGATRNSGHKYNGGSRQAMGKAKKSKNPLPLVTIANRSRQVHSNALPNNQWNSQASQNDAQPEVESHMSGSNTQNGATRNSGHKFNGGSRQAMGKAKKSENQDIHQASKNVPQNSSPSHHESHVSGSITENGVTRNFRQQHGQNTNNQNILSGVNSKPISIDECVENSKQQIVNDYKKIAEEFDGSIMNISEPIFGDAWMKNFMIRKLFKPCSAYIEQVNNFEKHYEMVNSYVFRKFLDDINPQSFNPDVIYNQVLDASGWENAIKKFPAGKQLGQKSRMVLKNIVDELYKDRFKKKYIAWFKAGRTSRNSLKQSVTIQLTECDNQYKKCLNLVGVLMINYNPVKQKASMRLIGGVFLAKHTKTETIPMNDLYARIGDETMVQKLEYLWSYHRNLAKIRNTLDVEFSHLFGTPISGFDSNSVDNKSCGTVPNTLKTPSDCEKEVKPLTVWQKLNPKNWGRKRRETTDNMINNDVDDTVKCILTNGTNCENSHSIQKRSFRKNIEEFRDSFYEHVNKKVSGYSERLDFRDFERSACMLNKFDSDRSKKIGYNLQTDIRFDKLEISFAKFLVDMFGDAKSCSYCLTTVLQEYYYEFKDHIEKIKNDIKDQFFRSATKKEFQPLNQKFKLGEMAYINYYIHYEIMDWKDTSNPANKVVDPMMCIMMPTTPGCEKNTNSATIPQNINIAYYAFYSEIKLRQTSMKEHEIIPLKHRFKEEVMKGYFEYQFIKDMIRAMPVDYHQKFPRNVINGEKHILSVVNDIEYPTSHGVCSEIVSTFENCYTKYGKKRHFIFLIDGSGSVSDSDFNNMKKSIESMVYYPLNGQNSLSIIDFGSSPQQLCYDEYSPDRIDSCIYSKSKSGGTTDINGAMDYAVKNYINTESNPAINHVVAIFTDGVPDYTVQHKVAELRRMPRVTVTGFGIGDAFESQSALQELKYITGDNRANLDEQKYRIRNFVEFEKNRLDLQNTICSA